LSRYPPSIRTSLAGLPPETTVPPETEELSLLDAGERLAMLWRVLVAGSGILLLALLGAA